MDWQDWIVAAVTVVVAAVVIRGVWRLFTCRDTQCSSCTKECKHREERE